MKNIFIIGLVIRLICLYLFKNINNYDFQSYLQIGELTLKGINIYPDIANLHHPYLPFFLYIEALAFYLGGLGWLGILIIKAINILFDLGITYMVYLLSKKDLKKTFLYTINPVTILITTLHGQFDVIPIFFILLSIYCLKEKKELIAILTFSMAILTKTWPALFFIPIVKMVKNKRLLILIFIFPILFISIYAWFFKSSLLNITKTLIYYQGLWGIWGPMSLISQMRSIGLIWQKLTTLLFLTCFFGYSYFNNKKNLVEEMLSLLFFFFVFTSNFSIQYFAWIIPFLIIIKPKKYLFLIILITFYLLSFYYFWLFCDQSKATPQWLVITQNIIGLGLWLSFVKVRYLSEKKP